MIKQFIIIFGITYLGEILSWYMPFPISGAVIGMMLLFLGLYFKVVKAEQIDHVANFLFINISLLVVTPSVRILNSLEHLSSLEIWLKIIVLMVVTTIITMAVTGRVIQALIQRKRKHATA